MLSQQSVFKKVVEVRYQRFLLIARDRGVQSLRRSEMRKHPSSKPAAVAAIGRVPLVLVYGWDLFGFIYSWRSSLISFLSSFSSHLFIPFLFYFSSFLSSVLLVLFELRIFLGSFYWLSPDELITHAKPAQPLATHGRRREHFCWSEFFMLCSVVRRHWDMPISFIGSSLTCTY